MKDLTVEEKYERKERLERRMLKVQKKVAWRRAKVATFQDSYVVAILSIIFGCVGNMLISYGIKRTIIYTVWVFVTSELLILLSNYYKQI